MMLWNRINIHVFVFMWVQSKEVFYRMRIFMVFKLMIPYLMLLISNQGTVTGRELTADQSEREVHLKTSLILSLTFEVVLYCTTVYIST